MLAGIFHRSEVILQVNYGNQDYVKFKHPRIVTLNQHSQHNTNTRKKGKRKVQGVPQSQTAALPRPQEEEKTAKSKQDQIEQTYEKH